MTIGVTGPSGAGKGAVSKMLKAHGFIHIDTDIVAREAVCDTLPALTERFGKDILLSDGSLNRSALAKKAFASDENTKALNGIMHGAIMDRVKEKIAYEQKNGRDKFVVDGAALFEANANEICDFTISVLCDEKTRLSRIVSRDGITEREARQRFARQLSDGYFKEHSDFVIYNNDLRDTKKQLSNILNIIYGGTK